jgi:hypothetical protein
LSLLSGSFLSATVVGWLVEAARLEAARLEAARLEAARLVHFAAASCEISAIEPEVERKLGGAWHQTCLVFNRKCQTFGEKIFLCMRREKVVASLSATLPQVLQPL